MNKDELSIFLHIPKTGGTTLNTIFKQQYNADEFLDHGSFKDIVIDYDQLTKQEKSKLSGISGHFFYGIHERFTKPFTYFTLLRDPVDRVISLYYFLRNYPGYERLKNMTLEEYVIMEDEAHNEQTVLLCGLPVNPDVQKAKETLKTFTVVGTAELFNESLFLLKKEYGWSNIHYKKRNVTKDRPSKEELSSTVINLIEKYNEMDLEVYEFAKQLLQQKLQSLTEEEQKQLQTFKQEQRRLS